MSFRRAFFTATVLSCCTAVYAQTSNNLTRQEAAQGWHLLFDGKTSNGWRSIHNSSFPSNGWEVKDGMISVTEHGGEEGGNAGDIITTRKYANFELSVDFRITTGANSGIKYFVDPDLNKGEGSAIGLEYQILDDAVHPDAKKGNGGDRTLASLYDLIPAAKNKPVRPIGEWNTARIVVRGAHCEQWLNGVKVVEYERFTPQFRKLVAESKYHVWPGFGEAHDGYILLQDHGFPVSFRNIKIRELPSAK
ncbi:MAG TPA: DUF1080 domain-containing protein [Edaphobacter sp.]|nr:DUF1080 domain-containing protein [Edaphobacter sp.]